MKGKLILYGNGCFAELMKYYIDNDDNRTILAVTVEKKYVDEEKFCELPLVAFEELEKHFSPTDDIEILICVGYSAMNDHRKRIFEECKNKGYKIASFIHSSVNLSNAQLGEGNIILEDTLLEPFVVLGSGNILWYRICVAHNSKIGDFNTITGMASICGFVEMGNNCFIGNSAIIRDKVFIDDYTLVGAGAYVSQSTERNSVVVPAKSIVLEGRSSKEFL